MNQPDGEVTTVSSAPPPKDLFMALQGLPLAAWEYHPRIGSTNDRALAWAEAGAPDGCLVLADEQVRGRGRQGRAWHTPPGTALALSWLVRPLPQERPFFSRWAALAALALSEALEALGAFPRIKWPNDVLLHKRKVAGVLVEALWQGPTPLAVVIGLGVNVNLGSEPPHHAVDFPAGSVESLLGRSVNRWALLRSVLERLLAWRPYLGHRHFIRAWERRLAYRHQPVQVDLDDGTTLQGLVAGLADDGGLRLETAQGLRIVHQARHVRPLNPLL